MDEYPKAPYEIDAMYLSSWPTRSVGISKLAAAVAKTQAKVQHAKKDSENPFFKSKYADLASVVDACRSAMAENGLSVIQPTRVAYDKDGKPFTILVTVLLHESGEFTTGEMAIRPMMQVKDRGWVPSDDPQSHGSALTYARRSALASIICVATEDDDAQAATRRIGDDHARPASTPSALSDDKKTTDNDENLRRELVDRATLYSSAHGIDFEDAIVEFTKFPSKDKKTKEPIFNRDGSPQFTYEKDVRRLSGRWLIVAVSKARDMTKGMGDREEDDIFSGGDYK